MQGHEQGQGRRLSTDSTRVSHRPPTPPPKPVLPAPRSSAHNFSDSVFDAFDKRWTRVDDLSILPTEPASTTQDPLSFLSAINKSRSQESSRDSLGSRPSLGSIKEDDFPPFKAPGKLVSIDSSETSVDRLEKYLDRFNIGESEMTMRIQSVAASNRGSGFAPSSSSSSSDSKSRASLGLVSTSFKPVSPSKEIEQVKSLETVVHPVKEQSEPVVDESPSSRSNKSSRVRKISGSIKDAISKVWGH